MTFNNGVSAPAFFKKRKKRAANVVSASAFERIMAAPPCGTYSSPAAAMATLIWAFFFSFFF
jgi:hypothetical protein